MAGATSTEFEVPRLAGRHVLIVEARFHTAINEMLVTGAKRVLESAGVGVDHVVVPGALEIPPVIAQSLGRGAHDGYVALGCVIRGETYHFEIVANESSRGLMDLGTRDRAVIGNGILTVESEAQAIERADPDGQDKGGGAALAACIMLELKDRLSR